MSRKLLIGLLLPRESLHLVTSAFAVPFACYLPTETTGADRKKNVKIDENCEIVKCEEMMLLLLSCGRAVKWGVA